MGGGTSENSLKERFRALFKEAKLEAFLSGLADSTRSSYKSSWVDCGRLCFPRHIPVWLTPRIQGWDEPLLGFFLIWTRNVLGIKASTLKNRLSAIRFTHLIDENVYFSLQPHRGKATIKGLRKLEGVTMKHPRNTDLARWMRNELVIKPESRNSGKGSLQMELYTAYVLCFFYLLRIYELEGSKWVTFRWARRAGGRFSSIRIKQSKTDVFRDGVLCPVKHFLLWKEMAYRSGDEESPISSVKFRERMGDVEKMSAIANGMYDGRIDTHSLRDGGAAALYTQWAPLDVIQRWGRWMSLTSHQYLRHEAAAQNNSPQVFAKSHGLIEFSKLMNKNAKASPCQEIPSALSGADGEMGTGDKLADSALSPRTKITARVSVLRAALETSSPKCRRQTFGPIRRASENNTKKYGMAIGLGRKKKRRRNARNPTTMMKSLSLRQRLSFSRDEMKWGRGRFRLRKAVWSAALRVHTRTTSLRCRIRQQSR